MTAKCLTSIDDVSLLAGALFLSYFGFGAGNVYWMFRFSKRLWPDEDIGALMEGDFERACRTPPLPRSATVCTHMLRRKDM